MVHSWRSWFFRDPTAVSRFKLNVRYFKVMATKKIAKWGKRMQLNWKAANGFFRMKRKADVHLF